MLKGEVLLRRRAALQLRCASSTAPRGSSKPLARSTALLARVTSWAGLGARAAGRRHGGAYPAHALLSVDRTPTRWSSGRRSSRRRASRHDFQVLDLMGHAARSPRRRRSRRSSPTSRRSRASASASARTTSPGRPASRCANARRDVGQLSSIATSRSRTRRRRAATRTPSTDANYARLPARLVRAERPRRAAGALPQRDDGRRPTRTRGPTTSSRCAGFCSRSSAGPWSSSTRSRFLRARWRGRTSTSAARSCTSSPRAGDRVSAAQNDDPALAQFPLVERDVYRRRDEAVHGASTVGPAA